MSLSQTPSPSAGCKGRAHKESSLLAPKVRVQPLLEIYTAEVRFTRKIIFLQKIHSLKSRARQRELLAERQANSKDHEEEKLYVPER